MAGLDEGDDLPEWLTGPVAAAIFAAASAVLLGLLWWYVPTQAAVLVGLEGRLPILARLALSASIWTTRLFPLLLLVILVLVARGVVGPIWRFEGVARALLYAALAEILASGVIVYSLHDAVEQARSSAESRSGQGR